MSEGAPFGVTVPALALRLVQRNHDEYAATTQRLIDNLTEQLAEARAELAAVRGGIRELYSHPWNPRSFHVLAALQPLPEDIDRYRTDAPG